MSQDGETIARIVRDILKKKATLPPAEQVPFMRGELDAIESPLKEAIEVLILDVQNSTLLGSQNVSIVNNNTNTNTANAAPVQNNTTSSRRSERPNWKIIIVRAVISAVAVVAAAAVAAFIKGHSHASPTQLITEKTRHTAHATARPVSH